MVGAGGGVDRIKKLSWGTANDVSIGLPPPRSLVKGGGITAILVEPSANRDEGGTAFLGLRVRLTQGGEGLARSGRRVRLWERRELGRWPQKAQAQGQGRVSRPRKRFQELLGRDRAGREQGHLTQDRTRGLVVESVVVCLYLGALEVQVVGISIAR